MNIPTMGHVVLARVTPKDFFLWAGAMISLYWTVVAFINLFFSYIDRAYPDPLTANYIDITSSSVRFEMASLIVLTPVFLGLMYLIRQTIDLDPSRIDIWVRRWALYLTVFFSGISIVSTFVYVINDFLSGTLATPFLLKAFIVVAVASIGFMHFLADIWGYWRENPQYSRSVALSIVVLIIATIASGFIIYGTPQQARLYRFDYEKVSDLQQIQNRVEEYVSQNNRLPDQLNMISGEPSGFHDPQSGVIYEYHSVSTTTYTLCADFNAPTQPGEDPGYYAYRQSETWIHEAGHTCFLRVVSPVDETKRSTPAPIPKTAPGQ